MTRIKAVFYLPLKDNDGRSLAQEIDAVESEVFIHFSGWTFEGYVKGTYRMPDGSRALDESAAYSVSLDENDVPELERILRDFRGKTTQEAIYLEIQRAVDVRFIQ